MLDPPRCRRWPTRPAHDIVTSSGDTLLGADDKAGVAEIMAAVAHLAAHPELPRPTLRIGFTPDEEIGEGATLFDVERFGARCAYTLDGSQPGELQDETFTGAEVLVEIEGVDVHPGLGRRASWSTRRGSPAACSPRCPPTASRPRRPRAARASSIRTRSRAAGRATLRCIARDFDDDAARASTSSCAPHGRGGRRDRAARAAEGRRAPQYPNMRRHIEPFPRSSSAPSARSAPRASSRCARRSAAAPTARTSAPRACRRPTSSPAATSTTRRASGPRVQDMAAAAAVVVRLAGEWADG